MRRRYTDGVFMMWIIILLVVAIVGTGIWLATRSWPADRASASKASASKVPAGQPAVAPPAGQRPPVPTAPAGIVTMDELRIAVSDVLDGPRPADAAEREAVERLGLGQIPDLTAGQAAVLLAAHKLAETQIDGEIGLKDGYDGEKRIEATLVGFIVNDPELRARAMELTRPRPRTLGSRGAAGHDPRDIRVREKLRELLSDDA